MPHVLSGAGGFTNEEFAKNIQFGTRIAHGAYTIGLVSAAVSRISKRVPPPGAVYYRNELKTSSRAYPEWPA
jgi:3-hydroxybutyryl-CoA dehydratase